MLYLSAIVIFFALHALPFNRNIRNTITSQIGEKTYKIVFQLIIVATIALGVWGWNDFPNNYFYEPTTFLKQIHLAIMFPVVYLWIAAEVPNNIKRFVKHPMLTGIILWALGHILANGDLRSLLLFISFLSYSIIAIILEEKRDEPKEVIATPLVYDFGVLVASVILYCTLVYFHDNLFGMPVMPYFMRAG